MRALVCVEDGECVCVNSAMYAANTVYTLFLSVRWWSDIVALHSLQHTLLVSLLACSVRLRCLLPFNIVNISLSACGLAGFMLTVSI